MGAGGAVMTRVGVGVAGYGYWGPNLTRVFNESPQSRVVAVCDRDAARLRRVVDRYPGTWTTGSFEEMLARPEVEAVVVATPVSTHYKLARAALGAGKHVLVEKPLATDVTQLRELYALARDLKRVLMGGYTFLYSPPVVAIKKIIESGTIGELYYIDSSRVNLGLHQFDVSVLWDLGPHDLSMILYWTGELPLWVQAVGNAYEGHGHEDVAWIGMEFPRGVYAHVHVSWIAPTKLRRTTITGGKQMILYDDLEVVEKVRIFDQGVKESDEVEARHEQTVAYRFGDIRVPRVSGAEPLAEEAGDFLGCIRSGGTPRSSEAIGLGITATLAAAEESVRRQGARVAL